MLGWTDELARALAGGLTSPSLGALWAEWASEVAADAFAHVHTGYAAAAALHDVLDGGDDSVFRYLPGDPHPVSYLRVLMTVEMCRRTFGAGPWDRLAAAWTAKHRRERSPSDIRPVLEDSVRVMPLIVEIILTGSYRALGRQPLTRLIDPQRVSPASLNGLNRAAGAAAFSSPYWAWNEAIRLLALTGTIAGEGASQLRSATAQQEQWMLRLGGLRQAA